MSPTSYRAAPPRGDAVTLAQPAHQVNAPGEKTARRPAGATASAADAVGLGRLVASRPRERPQHAPGPARGEQPVGLAPERAPELRAQRRAREIHGAGEIGAEALQQVLGD